MLDALFNWLGNNYPTLLFMIALAVVVWQVAKVFFNSKHRIETVEETIKTLPCESHKEQLDNYSIMKETLSSVNEQVTSISKWVMKLEPGMIDVLAQKCSPRRMTTLGRDLFIVSGAKEVVDTNESFFIQEIDKKSPATPYDVEEVSLSVILSHIANPMFNGIKNYIYYQPEEVELTGDNNTKQKVKISLNSLIQLMALEIRDRYLTAHPELK